MTTLPEFLNDPDGITHFLARTRADFDRACTVRDDYVSLWQDCYTYTIPENARFTRTFTSPSKAYAQLYDGTAPDAVDQLAASLLANLTPAWTNWFSVDPGHEVDDEMRADLLPLLAKSTAVLQDQVDRSNLYSELHQCFLDLVVGGTGCLYIHESPIGSPVRFRVEVVPFNDVILGADARGNLSTVYRHRVVTGAEYAALCDLTPFIHRAPPPDTLSDSGLSSSEETIEIIEFCTPHNGHYLVGAMRVNAINNRDLIYLIPRDTSPYLIFRWQKTPGVPFGRSPVMKALPDIKCANKVVELILKNASIAATGIWQAEDDGVLNFANIQLTPGAIIPKAVGSAGLKPLDMPARFDVSQLVLDDLRARIRHALLTDRFAALDAARMTATEVRERSDAALQILSAIYGRLQGELLTPLLTHLYEILRAGGDIADLPLDGRTVIITPLSPLARVHAKQGIEATLTLVDGLNRIGSGTNSLIQARNTALYLAEILGVPEHLIAPEPSLSSTTPLI